jgi:hypothetical protein
VLDDAVKLFGGIIITAPRGFVGNAGEMEVSVTAQDYQTLMSRKLVFQSYENQTAGAIATDYRSKISSLGFTVGNIEAGGTLQKWIANGGNFSDEFENLAKSIGFVWYADYNKAIYFFNPTGAFGVAAWDLTEAATTPFLSNAAYSNLLYNDDVTQIRNIITVRGAKTPGNLSTQTIIADGSRRTFILDLGNATKGTLTMSIGGTGQLLGEEGVADPATVDWLVNYQNRSVFAADGSTPTPTAGVTISFQYRYETQIIVTARNNASIATYGEWEHLVVDATITDRSIATQRAKAELDSFGSSAVTVAYTTSRAGLRAGTRQRVTVPRLGVSGEFLIKSLTIRLISYAPNGMYHQAAGYVWQWDVQGEKIGA